jgi:hypothetical protein
MREDAKSFLFLLKKPPLEGRTPMTPASRFDLRKQVVHPFQTWNQSRTGLCGFEPDPVVKE